LFKGKFIIAVPARLESSRLPNKVLEDISGEPMLKRVLDRINNSQINCKTLICTDSETIKKLVEDWGFEVIKTKKNCSSGTERISSVLDQIIEQTWNINCNKVKKDTYTKLLKETFIMNIQADQPLLSKKLLKECIDEIMNNYDNQIITPIYPLQKEEIHDPNIVKVINSKTNKALYFSRSPIPYARGINKDEWYKYNQYWGHVGIYCYRADFLSNIDFLSKSRLEDMEKLEQLRFLDAGYTIHCFKTENQTLSVDNISQLNKVRELYRISSHLHD